MDNKVTDFYEKGTGDASTLEKFMDLVEKIRVAETKGIEAIPYTNDKGLTFIIRVIPEVRSGVYTKCGNYTAAITENITILPPSKEDAFTLLATNGEASTSLSTKAYKEFLGIWGGVNAHVALTESPIESPSTPAGSGAQTDVDTGPKGSEGATKVVGD